MKSARIVDEDDNGYFGLEYDNDRGTKSTMRLEASTYELAIREARSYLGIKDNDQDEDGSQWQVE